MKNLIVRSISGIAFIIIMIGGILWGVLPYAIIMSCIIAAMMYEYMTIAIGNKLALHKTLAIIAGVAFFITLLCIQLYNITPLYLLVTLLPLLGIFIANLYVKEFNSHEFTDKAEKPKNNTTPNGIRVNNGYEVFPFAITSFIYVAVPMSMCNFIVLQPEYSGSILLSMFIILWATDVGAYCLGSTLGQKYGKRLFPSVSPKKSWIGFWGGMLSAVIAAVILQAVNLLEINIGPSVALAIIICIFGVWGDLIESQLKRNFGVKDSGNIMPGHGGMLDRFDGALIAFPVAIIFLKFLI